MDALSLAVGVLVGAGGLAALLGLATWLLGDSAPVPAEIRELFTSHEHDWHISGKDEGVVMQECACGATRERPE